MYRLSLFIIVCFISSFSFAITVKEIAEKSVILLSMTENEELIKKCKTNIDTVSIKSFDLQAQLDVKIQTLTAADMRLIKKRSQTCEQDCSCSIYSIVLEKKGLTDKLVSQKAEALTAHDRKKCIRKIKDICGKYLR